MKEKQEAKARFCELLAFYGFELKEAATIRELCELLKDAPGDASLSSMLPLIGILGGKTWLSLGELDMHYEDKGQVLRLLSSDLTWGSVRPRTVKNAIYVAFLEFMGGPQDGLPGCALLEEVLWKDFGIPGSASRRHAVQEALAQAGVTRRADGLPVFPRDWGYDYLKLAQNRIEAYTAARLDSGTTLDLWGWR